MRVVFAAYPQIQSLDLFGPLEVFHTAGRLAGAEKRYECRVVAPAPVVTSSGVTIEHRPLRSASGPIDTLIIPGGTGGRDEERDRDMVPWIAAAASRSRRVASVCSGALLLARTGLLDGRRATTHWAWCDELARRHPSVRVEADRIYVRDGRIWTSAGVTAGMDLALAMVEDDLGPEIATETARWLVLFAKRPGGQGQYSSNVQMQRAEQRPLREVQDLVASHPEGDLSVERLAEVAAMSVRGFARAFRREVGMTPGSYVETVRIERARLALTSSTAKVEVIARNSGFGTPETMRRAFARRLGVSPSDYRQRFAFAEATPPEQEALHA